MDHHKACSMPDNNAFQLNEPPKEQIRAVTSQNHKNHADGSAREEEPRTLLFLQQKQEEIQKLQNELDQCVENCVQQLKDYLQAYAEAMKDLVGYSSSSLLDIERELSSSLLKMPREVDKLGKDLLQNSERQHVLESGICHKCYSDENILECQCVQCDSYATRGDQRGLRLCRSCSSDRFCCASCHALDCGGYGSRRCESILFHSTSGDICLDHTDKKVDAIFCPESTNIINACNFFCLSCVNMHCLVRLPHCVIPHCERQLIPPYMVNILKSRHYQKKNQDSQIIRTFDPSLSGVIHDAMYRILYHCNPAEIMRFAVTSSHNYFLVKTIARTMVETLEESRRPIDKRHNSNSFFCPEQWCWKLERLEQDFYKNYAFDFVHDYPAAQRLLRSKKTGIFCLTSTTIGDVDESLHVHQSRIVFLDNCIRETIIMSNKGTNSNNMYMIGKICCTSSAQDEDVIQIGWIYDDGSPEEQIMIDQHDSPDNHWIASVKPSARLVARDTKTNVKIIFGLKCDTKSFSIIYCAGDEMDVDNEYDSNKKWIISKDYWKNLSTTNMRWAIRFHSDENSEDEAISLRYCTEVEMDSFAATISRLQMEDSRVQTLA